MTGTHLAFWALTTFLGSVSGKRAKLVMIEPARGRAHWGEQKQDSHPELIQPMSKKLEGAVPQPIRWYFQGWLNCPWKTDPYAASRLSKVSENWTPNFSPCPVCFFSSLSPPQPVSLLLRALTAASLSLQSVFLPSFAPCRGPGLSGLTVTSWLCLTAKLPASQIPALNYCVRLPASEQAQLTSVKMRENFSQNRFSP